MRGPPPASPIHLTPDTPPMVSVSPGLNNASASPRVSSPGLLLGERSTRAEVGRCGAAYRVLWAALQPMTFPSLPVIPPSQKTNDEAATRFLYLFGKSPW